jgi:hypothetical protein
MSAKLDDDTVSYLIRDCPGPAWRLLKVRAIIEQRNIRDVLVGLIEEYGQGKPTIKPERRRK